MISILSCPPALVPALLDVWQTAAGTRHPVLPALWEANTVGDPSFRPADLLVALEDERPVGFILCKQWRGTFPGCERYASIGFIALMAVAPDRQRQGTGTQLLAAAEAHLQTAGCLEVRLGGSFHHFLPGIPGDSEGAKAFFTARGYALGQTVHDVRRRLDQGEALPAAPVAIGFTVRPFEPIERPLLETFLRETFPGRWARDVAHFLATGGDIHQVMGVFTGAQPVGFAWIHPPGSEGTLRWAGFNPEMAALGPIGMAEWVRGKGLGLSLLVGGIERLKMLGARDMVIDWTDLLAFYGRCGFEPWLSYTLAKKDLV